MICSENVYKYSEDEKMLAQNLNFLSTRTYNFMRHDLKFNLPHKTSLHRWQPVKSVQPGLDPSVLKNLKSMIDQMPEQYKICQIIMDEVSIKRDLTYNKSHDIIDGYIHLDHNQRENALGNQCLFFMVKSIFGNWKSILSYYVSKDGMRGDQLKPILQQNITAANEIGLQIKAVVCDQGSNNRKMMTLFGVTDANPSVDVDGTIIHFMFDYCHLIKNIRNTLLKNDIETPEGLASFRVIKDIYEIDRKNPNFKICPKLTQAHIYPTGFQKMRVERATQVLSNSVAAGIKYAVQKNLLSDSQSKKCANGTRDFVQKMNNLFDDMDCKILHHKNPLKRPLFRGDDEKKNRLNEYKNYLKSIKLTNNRKIYCIDGFILTINSMLNLSEDIFEKHSDLSFILLGKLNQDALENFFGRVRSSLGANNHPSQHELQYIVAKLISMKILRYPFTNNNSNCKEDHEFMLDWSNAVLENDLENDPVESAIEFDDTEEENIEESEAESGVQRYYTGYGILKSIVKKINCSRCIENMKKSNMQLEDPSEYLIKAKNYLGDEDIRLINPSDEVFEVCVFQYSCYKKAFLEYSYKTKVKERIMDYIISETNLKYKDYFSSSDPCTPHKKDFLNFLVTVLLYKNSKWLCQKILNDLQLEKLERMRKQRQKQSKL